MRFLQSPPIGFNISSSTTANFSSTSNGFNGLSSTFNSTTSNQGTSSPLSDLDEFDIISNRNKVGSSPLPMNNGECNQQTLF